MNSLALFLLLIHLASNGFKWDASQEKLLKNLETKIAQTLTTSQTQGEIKSVLVRLITGMGSGCIEGIKAPLSMPVALLKEVASDFPAKQKLVYEKPIEVSAENITFIMAWLITYTGFFTRIEHAIQRLEVKRILSSQSSNTLLSIAYYYEASLIHRILYNERLVMSFILSYIIPLYGSTFIAKKALEYL